MAVHAPVATSSIKSWFPAMILLAIWLAVEPTRPLFFWLLGPATGFHAYFVTRLALLLLAIALAIRTPLHFEWRSQTAPPGVVGSDALLTLRGFACAVVMLGHGTAVVFPPANLEALIREKSPFQLLMVCPWIGVWIFFVLSGYLMGKAFYAGRYDLHWHGIKQFYTNRFLRIAPVYWVATLVLNMPQLLRAAVLPGLFSYLLFFPSNSMPFVAIGALWSVQTEVAFYICAPFLFVVLAAIIARGVRPITIAAVFVCAGIFYRCSMLLVGKVTGVSIWNLVICVPTISNIDLFVTGMLTNWLLTCCPKSLRWPYFGTVACGALVLGSAVLFAQSRLTDEGKLQLQLLVILGPAVTAVLVAATIASLETAMPRGRIVRGTQWAGLISYTLYVCHEPVYNVVSRFSSSAENALQSLALTVLATAISCLAAVALYSGVERPPLRWKSTRPHQTRPI